MEINMKSIHNKLLIIQQSIDKFVQDGQAHGYKYTTGSTVLNRVRPLMNELGLLLNQEVIGIANNRMDYTLKNGNSKSEILTTLEIRFTWVDCESGETLVSHFAANGQNDWDKGLGSALTYAERYYLLKFFHIPTDEDDVDKPKAEPKPESDLPWLNKDTEAFNQAKAYISKGGSIADIRKKYKVSKEVEGLLK
jgi:hypothetical protein